MHHLLIPYAFLSAAFVVQFHLRRDVTARTGIVFTAGITLALLFVSIVLRPVAGDSWRYYQYFLYLRSMGLLDAMAYREPDVLFTSFIWLVGHLGSAPWLLFTATLTVYVGVFLAALYRLIGLSGAAVLLICYSAFPYFVAYGASGLRHGLALVFLLMAFVCFQQNRRTAWVWLLLAPLWHSGAWLAVAVTFMHWLLCRFSYKEWLRWSLVMLALLLSIILSASGLNEPLLSQLPDYVDLQKSHDIYFTDAARYGYRSGFRWDFLLFSLLPLGTGLLFRKTAATFRYSGSGWWLSLYLSLNCIYHLFSFAPFTDRFAVFSWFLMPLVVFLQIRETNRKNLMTLFVAAICLVNVVMLQFYTGNFIPAPRGW